VISSSFFGIQHHHRGTQPDFAVRNLGEVHHGHLGQPVLQLVQARVDEALALLGRMILGVLAQVAVQPGLEDLPGQFVAQLVLEQGDLVLQFLFDFVRSHRTIIGQSPGSAWQAEAPAPHYYWGRW
jgi:hypothetical protein